MRLLGMLRPSPCLPALHGRLQASQQASCCLIAATLNARRRRCGRKARRGKERQVPLQRISGPGGLQCALKLAPHPSEAALSQDACLGSFMRSLADGRMSCTRLPSFSVNRT